MDSTIGATAVATPCLARHMPLVALMCWRRSRRRSRHRSPVPSQRLARPAPQARHRWWATDVGSLPVPAMARRVPRQPTPILHLSPSWRHNRHHCCPMLAQLPARPRREKRPPQKPKSELPAISCASRMRSWHPWHQSSQQPMRARLAPRRKEPLAATRPRRHVANLLVARTLISATAISSGAIPGAVLHSPWTRRHWHRCSRSHEP